MYQSTQPWKSLSSNFYENNFEEIKEVYQRNIDIFGQNDQFISIVFWLFSCRMNFVLLPEFFIFHENFTLLWEFSSVARIFFCYKNFLLFKISPRCKHSFPLCKNFSFAEYANSLLVNHRKHALIDCVDYT